MGRIEEFRPENPNEVWDSFWLLVDGSELVTPHMISEPASNSVSNPRVRIKYSSRRLFLWVTCTGIVFAMLIAFSNLLRDAQQAAIAMSSESHLNQLQLALHNYHDDHGHFPPAFLADKSGTPIHSWRVLILPYIEHQALYDAYDFDEPWNGSNNRKLADHMPPIFHMPHDPTSTSMTNIVAIVGPGTAFPGSKSTRLRDFTDGLDNTILLTEISSSNICWMEPRDLRVDEMSFTVNDRRQPSISSSRRRGPYAVFTDSIRAYQLSTLLRPETVRALTTIAGGEDLYIGEVENIGLVSIDDGPGTDEKIERLRCDNLRSLWLSRSDISDAALPHLATALSLSKLHLRSTNITDDGLRNFLTGRPPHFLDLGCTAISDNGLRHLAALSNLEYPGITIDLRGSRVTMEGVAQFLKSIPEPDSPLQVSLQIDEGSVTHKYMLFSRSNVDDGQLKHFQGLTSIHQASLNETKITDLSLEYVATFIHLIHLDVAGTEITDSGLEHLKGMTQLQWVNLHNTGVTDDGVIRLQETLPRCKINH